MTFPVASLVLLGAVEDCLAARTPEQLVGPVADRADHPRRTCTPVIERGLRATDHRPGVPGHLGAFIQGRVSLLRGPRRHFLGSTAGSSLSSVVASPELRLLRAFNASLRNPASPFDPVRAAAVQCRGELDLAPPGSSGTYFRVYVCVHTSSAKSVLLKSSCALLLLLFFSKLKIYALSKMEINRDAE